MKISKENGKKYLRVDFSRFYTYVGICRLWLFINNGGRIRSSKLRRLSTKKNAYINKT